MEPQGHISNWNPMIEMGISGTLMDTPAKCFLVNQCSHSQSLPDRAKKKRLRAR